MNFDLIIKNGTVVDGTGMPGRKIDVGLKGDKIASLDKCIPETSSPVIYADELIVVPGFVDIHSHSDFLWLIRPESDSKIFDGVTTEICGNCGLSAFPLRGKVLERRAQGLEKYNINLTWRSAAEFFSIAEHKRSAINRAFLVGHGNVRACTVEYENRKPKPHEFVQMCNDLEEAMSAGAFGMSSGLIYPPGCYAATDEIVEMCKVIKRYGGFYATHIRNEGNTLENPLPRLLRYQNVPGSDYRCRI